MVTVARAAWWVAVTTEAAQWAQDAGVAEALVLLGTVVASGGWTAAVQRVLGKPWPIAWRAGGERAVEEVLVKSAGLLAVHALDGTIPQGWPLAVGMLVELVATAAIRRPRRQSGHR